MQDYGAFPGAIVTVAPCCNTINNSGEVAGFSIDPSGNSRALVWQGQVPVELNTLIPADSPLCLTGIKSGLNHAGHGLGEKRLHSGGWVTDQPEPLPGSSRIPGYPQETGITLTRSGARMTQRAPPPKETRAPKGRGSSSRKTPA
jgi:hypothetical protein